MGLFDRAAENEQSEVKQHKFISGNVGDLLSDLKRNKQDTGVDETENLSDLETQESEIIEDEPMQKLKARKDVSDVAGSSMALMADSFLPVLLAIFLQDDPENYKCTEDERESLEQAFADFSRIQGIEMPPWVVLAGTVLGIFGYKAYHGFKVKKLEAENKRLQDIVDKQEDKQE